jgi:E3 ubiquitin-protein ligase SHPRH
MESFGDYGSQVQTLVRHLLYLESTEPGTKSIVFSAWADSLSILQYALRENGIAYLRIDQRSRGQTAANKFKSDPTIRVLLLHGEKENAGLNITCASRVFLLESVVHHSFEIQAIARIDRMGQTQSTEVFCYYAEDTIERNILDLAARQGLSLYTRENSEGTLDLSSFSNLSAEKPQVDAPAKKAQKGDFIFRVDDMLAIMFPHMYEDVEYLLPVEEDEGPIASGSGSRM